MSPIRYRTTEVVKELLTLMRIVQSGKTKEDLLAA